MKKNYLAPIAKSRKFHEKDVLNNESQYAILSDGYDVMQNDFFSDEWLMFFKN